MEQQQSHYCQYPTGTKSEPGICGEPVGTPTEVGWDGMTTALYLCDEHATSYSQFLAMVRTVFERFEREREEGGTDDSAETAPENEIDSSEESGEDEETDWVCDSCGRAVPRGNPFFSLDVTICYVAKTTQEGRDELGVANSDHLMTLCSECGNAFNWQRLGALTKSLAGNGHLQNEK